MQKSSNLSDEELIVKIRTIDKELYIEIVERYELKLLRYLTYLINDENKAADVLQNTFIKAYINLNGFDIKKKFSSWIYRIAHNEAMNFIKKYKKEERINEDWDVEDNTNYEEDLSNKEAVAMINSCMNKMPIIYSEIIELYYLEEKSYEEISDILRIPKGTVATRLNRGKEMMKKICKK